MALQISNEVRYDFSLIGDHDLHLFNEGSQLRLCEKLGAHEATVDGRVGTFFAVWAPNADRGSVKGNFNCWSNDSHPLRSRGDSGIWVGFIPSLVTCHVCKQR